MSTKRVVVWGFLFIPWALFLTAVATYDTAGPVLIGLYSVYTVILFVYCCILCQAEATTGRGVLLLLVLICSGSVQLALTTAFEDRRTAASSSICAPALPEFMPSTPIKYTIEYKRRQALHYEEWAAQRTIWIEDTYTQIIEQHEFKDDPIAELEYALTDPELTEVLAQLRSGRDKRGPSKSLDYLQHQLQLNIADQDRSAIKDTLYQMYYYKNPMVEISYTEKDHEYILSRDPEIRKAKRFVYWYNKCPHTKDPINLEQVLVRVKPPLK